MADTKPSNTDVESLLPSNLAHDDSQMEQTSLETQPSHPTTFLDSQAPKRGRTIGSIILHALAFLLSLTSALLACATLLKGYDYVNETTDAFDAGTWFWFTLFYALVLTALALHSLYSLYRNAVSLGTVGLLLSPAACLCCVVFFLWVLIFDLTHTCALSDDEDCLQKNGIKQEWEADKAGTPMVSLGIFLVPLAVIAAIIANALALSARRRVGIHYTQN